MRRARIKSPYEKPWDTTLWALYLGQWDAAIRRADKLMNRLGTAKARAWALAVIEVSKERRSLNLPAAGLSRKDFDPTNAPAYMGHLLENVELELNPVLRTSEGLETSCEEMRALKTYFYLPSRVRSSVYTDVYTDGRTSAWSFPCNARSGLPSHRVLGVAIKAGFEVELQYKTQTHFNEDLSEWLDPCHPPLKHYRVVPYLPHLYTLVVRALGPLFSKLHRASPINETDT